MIKLFFFSEFQIIGLLFNTVIRLFKVFVVKTHFYLIYELLEVLI